MGPYSLEEVRSQFKAGAFQASDLAWQEGTPEWQPLSAMLNLVGAMPPPLPLSAAPPTSGLAITSLVLGIASFITVGLTGLPAIICGHLASAQIKRSNGRLAGGGIATAGLVTGYAGFLLIFVGVLAGIALPVFNSIQLRGKAVKSLNQAKSIALCCKLYAREHGGNFPDTLDQLIPMYLSDRRVLGNPLAEDQNAVGYEYYGGKDSDLGSEILLENRDAAAQHFHIVVYKDNSGKITRE